MCGVGVGVRRGLRGASVPRWVSVVEALNNRVYYEGMKKHRTELIGSI